MSTSGGVSPPAVLGNGSVASTVAQPGVLPLIEDGTVWRRLESRRVITDGSTGTNFLPVAVMGTTDGLLSSHLRTPAVFKFALASALGSTAVWTPAAGKKFRLMAYKMMLSQNASLAAGAQWTPAFLDAAAATGLSDTFFVPTAAGTTLGVVTSGWTTLGNGYLSSAANNVLNVNLPVALASSSLVVQVVGTEE